MEKNPRTKTKLDMSKLNQQRFFVDMDPEIVLTRINDGKTIAGSTVDWIEWNEDGTFKQKHNEPQVGYACIIDGHKFTYGWLTTTITEILDISEEYIKFKTENSEYKLKYKI